MKRSFLLCLTAVVICVFSWITGCKKNKPCEPVATGRIIGFNPCSYYTPTNNRKNAGFVVEIDKGDTKDTVACHNIPNHLFAFPEIDQFEAYGGRFLYDPALQDQFSIRFNYRLVTENELTMVLCLGIVNVAPFTQAVKDREIVVSCISKQ